MPQPLAALRFKTAPGHPAVDFDDLCLMLELEIMMGRKQAFRRRLRRALEAAHKQGAQP